MASRLMPDKISEISGTAPSGKMDWALEKGGSRRDALELRVDPEQASFVAAGGGIDYVV